MCKIVFQDSWRMKGKRTKYCTLVIKMLSSWKKHVLDVAILRLNSKQRMEIVSAEFDGKQRAMKLGPVVKWASLLLRYPWCQRSEINNFYLHNKSLCPWAHRPETLVSVKNMEICVSDFDLVELAVELCWAACTWIITATSLHNGGGWRQFLVRMSHSLNGGENNDYIIDNMWRNPAKRVNCPKYQYEETSENRPTGVKFPQCCFPVNILNGKPNSYFICATSLLIITSQWCKM